MNRRTLKRIFRRAAQHVDRNVYPTDNYVGCCIAINWAAGDIIGWYGSYVRYHAAAARILDSTMRPQGCYWGSDEDYWWPTTKAGKQARVYALLLCELMVDEVY